MSYLFNTFLFIPLYNLLVGLTDIIPGQELGLAVIALTIIVRLIIFPLSHKAANTQAKVKMVNPEIEKIREKYTDKQEQALKMMEVYRSHGINPFASFFLLLIQLPILLAIFKVFRVGLPIDETLLYSFVPFPEVLSSVFLGIDLAEKSLILALLVGITQFIQINLAMPALGPRKENATMQEDISRSMQQNMKYIMPVIISIVAFSFPSALALYWTTSNLFMIGHELLVKRKIEQEVLSKPTEELVESRS